MVSGVGGDFRKDFRPSFRSEQRNVPFNDGEVQERRQINPK